MPFDEWERRFGLPKGVLFQYSPPSTTFVQPPPANQTLTHLGKGAEGSVYNYLYSIGMTLFFSQLIAGLYEAVYYLGQWQQSVREAEALKKTNFQSQLDSLKNLVNPHFLFNSLTPCRRL